MNRPDTMIFQDKLEDVATLVHRCHVKHNQTQKNLEVVMKARARALLEKKLTSGTKSKLKNLYKNAIEDCVHEEDGLRKTLSVIQDIRSAALALRFRPERPKEIQRRGALMQQLRISALQLPLWVPSDLERPPPLCGAIPAESNYIAKIEDMVAALVRVSDSDETWILAKVSHYHSATGKYEVEDIDEEGRDLHLVSRKRVVPLPLMRANPRANPEAIFSKGTLVNALYPQTTCFYRALVEEVPVGPHEEYGLLFEDPSYPEGYSPPLHVAQRYVIYCKESTSRK